MKEKIKTNFGVGLEWIADNGLLYRSLPRRKPICLDFTINSYIGSIGGMHYYGKLYVPKPSVLEVESNKEYSLAGYGNQPEDFTNLDFDVKRILTKVEYDMSDELVGKIGDETYRFNTEREVIFAGLKLIQEKFEDNWNVNFQAYNGGNYKFPITDIKITKEFVDFILQKCEDCFTD